MAYPSPLLRTNFYVNKRKVSNKYNYTKFFLKKIQFQIQRLSVLVYAFVAIAEKFPFLLTSSLVKPLSPHVRKCQHFINPPPPRVLTSYVNGPLLITSLKSLMEHRINIKVPCFMWEGRLDKSSKAVNIFCLFLGIPCCYALVHFWNRGHQYSSL